MGMVGALSAIKDFIEDNIAESISRVEARDGITLTPYLVLQEYTSLGTQFPSITLHPASVEEMQIGAGNRPFYGNPSERDKVISIRVFDRGNKTTTNVTETNVTGYMDALEDLFMSDYALDGIKGVDILDTEFTDLFPDFSLVNEELLLKGAILRLRVRYSII